MVGRGPVAAAAFVLVCTAIFFACVGDDPATQPAEDGGTDSSTATEAGGQDGALPDSASGDGSTTDASADADAEAAAVACGTDAGAADADTFASAQVHPQGLVTDCTHVYWAETGNFGTTGGGNIRKCPLSGCGGAPPALVSNLDNPQFLAIDGSSVYWTNYAVGAGKVMKCGKNGCTNIPTILAEMQNQPSHIAVDANNVYWTNSGGTVMKCAIAGCNKMPTELANAQPSPTGIATDGVNVFWTNQGDGRVMKCPVGGCNNVPVAIATLQNGPAALTLFGNDLFWANGDSLMKCAKSGCGNSPLLLIGGLASVNEVAVDGTNVYTGLSGTSNVIRCSVNGCTGGGPTTVAPSQNVPIGIAVNADTLYWTGYNVGTVTRHSPK